MMRLEPGIIMTGHNSCKCKSKVNELFDSGQNSEQHVCFLKTFVAGSLPATV